MIPQVFEKWDAEHTLPTADEARQLMPPGYNASDIVAIIAKSIRSEARTGKMVVSLCRFGDVRYDKVPQATMVTVIQRLRDAGYTVGSFDPRDVRDGNAYLKISWEPK